MAVFKNKTGRGEVNYSRAVRASDGTDLFLATRLASSLGSLPTPGLESMLAFQLRGSGFDSVEDVSKSQNTLSLTNIVSRTENVDHATQLTTFGFNGTDSKVVFTPSHVPRSHVFFGNSALLNPNNLMPYRGDDGSSTDEFCIFSGYVYLDSLPTDGTNGGSCIMEYIKSDDTRRAMGLYVNSDGSLEFRLYSCGHFQSDEHFQGLRTQETLSTNKWYHFVVFHHGFLKVEDDANPDEIYFWNAKGLDESWTTSLAANSVTSTGVQVINSERIHVPFKGRGQVETLINRQKSAVSETTTKLSARLSRDGLDNMFAYDLAASDDGPFQSNYLADNQIILGNGLGGYDNGADTFSTNTFFHGRLSALRYWLFNATLGLKPGFQ